MRMERFKTNNIDEQMIMSLCERCERNKGGSTGLCQDDLGLSDVVLSFLLQEASPHRACIDTLPIV